MDMIWEGLSCCLSCSEWHQSSRDLSFKNTKTLHDEFLYDKAWISTRATHVIYARKTSTYMLLAFALSFVKLCWPLLEVCHALKIKITYTPPKICTTPTLGVGTETCLPSRSTQKCLTPTLGVNTKTYLIGFPSTK